MQRPLKGIVDHLAERRVVSVRAIPIAIPLKTPVRFSTRELSAREYVIIFVEADNGLIGCGYTYVGVHAARAVASFIEQALAPLLVGQPAHGPERPWAALFQEVLLLGRRGLALRALSALDLALWDLLGQAVNQPLYMILGGIRDEVPVYASGGYYRPGDPVENVQFEMERYVELGFTDFKIKVGGAPVHTDVERVRGAREAIGPDGRLALDANNAWSTPAEAVKFVRAVEAYDIWWIEEPLVPDDIPGHAEIARMVEVPVATGEIHATRWDFRDLITARAADILQPDAVVLGGISEWMKVAHAAEMFNLPVAPHWNANVHIHLAGAVGNCLTVEYFSLDEDIFNFEQILTDRLQPKKGKVRIPQRPGLGLALDFEAIELFKV